MGEAVPDGVYGAAPTRHRDQDPGNAGEPSHQQDHQEQKQQHPVLGVGVDQVIHRIHVVAGCGQGHGEE